jgi:hypothetical protein
MQTEREIRKHNFGIMVREEISVGWLDTNVNFIK